MLLLISDVWRSPPRQRPAEPVLAADVQGCAQAYDTRAIVKATEAVERVFSALNLVAFTAERSGVERRLVCLKAPLSPDVIARVHRAEALAAQVDGPPIGLCRRWRGSSQRSRTTRCPWSWCRRGTRRARGSQRRGSPWKGIVGSRCRFGSRTRMDHR